jgi:hypothetical protein
MGFKDRLKEAREKYQSKRTGGSKGSGVTTSTSKTSSVRAGRGKGLRGRNAIGTYVKRSGRVKNIRPLSPAQEARFPKVSAKWQKIPRDRLEKQAQSLQSGGVALACFGFLLFLGGIILLATGGYYNSYYMSIYLPLIFIGLIFMAGGGGAASSGGFRRKYLALTSGKKPKKVTKTVLEEIAIKFLKSP